MNLNHFVSYEYIDIIARNMIESHNLVSQVFIEISKRGVLSTWETFLSAFFFIFLRKEECCFVDLLFSFILS